MREVNAEILADRFKWQCVDKDTLPSGWAKKMEENPGYMLAPAFAPVLKAMGSDVEFYQSDIVYAILNSAKEFGKLRESYLDMLGSGYFNPNAGVVGAREYVVSILGLRQCGVDSATFVDSRTRDGDTSEYRSIWKTTVEFSITEYVFRTYKAVLK